MTSIVDSLVKSFSSFNLDIAVLLPVITLIGGTVIFLIMAVNALIAVYFERKISAFMQDRLGPMEVGIFGFKGGKKFWGGIGQTLADAIKLLVKEDILPNNADKFLMILAPFIIFTGAFLTFIGLPFAQNIVISDFNIGIFYIFAMSSIGVIGVILAGWSSNNKWSLYGSMRAAAQIISYELSVGLSLLTIIVLTGSLQFSEIIESQREGWWIFRGHIPALIAFIIFLIASTAETNRGPFDLAEAESELTAGFHTEYSGMKFAFFFLAEFINMFIVAAIGATVFLGGWMPLHFGALESFNAIMDFIPPIFWFFGKTAFIIFLMMWFKWTFPRLRIDQLLTLEWKYLLPINLINILVMAFFVLMGWYF